MSNPTSNLDVQNWYADTLSSPIVASDTTIPINNLPSPTEGYLIIDPDNTSNREVIHYNSKTGSAVVCATTGDRGLDGTTAIGHAQGTAVRMEYTTSHFDAVKNLYATPSGAVTATLIAPSAVDSTKVNFGGSGAGIWWQEIGRTTLAATAATISVAITGMKYMHVNAFLYALASVRSSMTFNNDGGNNYAFHRSDNGAADTTGNSTNGITMDFASVTGSKFVSGDIINAAASLEKSITFHTALNDGTSQGTGPEHSVGVGKWVNTAATISTITISNAGTVGQFLPNSELVILGHN